jgi:hypothetical protein
MLKIPPNFHLIQIDDPNLGQQFDSILILEFGSILLPVLGQSMSRGVPTGRIFSLFTAKVRDISIFCFFESMGVS